MHSETLFYRSIVTASFGHYSIGSVNNTNKICDYDDYKMFLGLFPQMQDYGYHFHYFL